MIVTGFSYLRVTKHWKCVQNCRCFGHHSGLHQARCKTFISKVLTDLKIGSLLALDVGRAYVIGIVRSHRNVRVVLVRCGEILVFVLEV